MQTQQHTARRTVARVEDKSMRFTPQAPELTDPFLTPAEDLFSAPGFEWHPHRGMETVTLVLDGVLEHGDNIGHASTLTAGDVQWMTGGRGIIHRELARVLAEHQLGIRRGHSRRAQRPR